MPTLDIKVLFTNFFSDLKHQAKMPTNVLIKEHGLIKGIDYVVYRA